MNDTPLQTGIHRELPTSQAYGPVERKGQAKQTRPPLSGLARLTLLALFAAAVGVLVGVIEGLVKSGHLFVPPLVVGTIYLMSAGLIATRIRWMPAVGALFAIIMLLGAATLGASAVFLRLTHPEDVFGFAEIWIQMAGTLIAAIAGIAATVQAIVQRMRASQSAGERS